MYSKRKTNKRKPTTKSVVRYPVRQVHSGSGAYRTRRIGGNGAYSYDNPGPFGRAGEAAGQLLGGRFGGPAGTYLLGKAGRFVGHNVGKLFGSGSYDVVHGDTTTMAPDPPRFSNNTRDDSVCISHREYLGDIITSSTIGALKVETFNLNPASNNVFPWLSHIAGPNFQQYKFDGLVFEFRSFSADALNSANTALGSVFACINYDSSDADFTSRNEIENSDWSRSAKPSESFMIPVECAPRQTAMQGLLYVANANNIPVGSDPKTYLLGKLSLGTTGFQAASVNIGSLYVTYKIRLYKPLLSRPESFSNISQWVRTGTSNTAPLGSTSLSPALNAIACDTNGLTFIDSKTIRLDKRRLEINAIYILRCEWQGTSSVSVQSPDPTLIVSTPTGYLEGVPNYVSTSNAFTRYPTAAVTDDKVGFVFSFRINKDDTDITLVFPNSGLALPGTAILTLNLWQINGVAPPQLGIFNGTA